MKILPCDVQNPESSLLSTAGQCLRDGGLVIFPTDTVYGVAANADHEEAVKRLYELKERPQSKPFSLLFADLSSFYTFAGKGLPANAREWFERLRDKPVTIVYFDGLRGKKIGIRIPEHVIAREFVKVAGCPVMAPSANFAGQGAPGSVTEIDTAFVDRVDLVLDAGPAQHRTESTVIDVSDKEPKVLRQGVFQL